MEKVSKNITIIWANTIKIEKERDMFEQIVYKNNKLLYGYGGFIIKDTFLTKIEMDVLK